MQLQYMDGLNNTFVNDNSVQLLCDVDGPHGLEQPARPLYYLPYVLDTEKGYFTIHLDFRQSGTHKVSCSVTRRGGVNVQYYGNAVWEDGPLLQEVVGSISIPSISSIPVLAPERDHVSARWDGNISDVRRIGTSTLF